jgi:hypothetical protein
MQDMRFVYQSTYTRAKISGFFSGLGGASSPIQRGTQIAA